MRAACLAGPALTDPSETLASGAGRLGGMTGPGRGSTVNLHDQDDLRRRFRELREKEESQRRSREAAIKRRWWEVSSPRDRLRELAIYSLSGMSGPERDQWWMRLEMSAGAVGAEDVGQQRALLRACERRDEPGVRAALRVCIEAWGQALDLPGQRKSEDSAGPPVDVQGGPVPKPTLKITAQTKKTRGHDYRIVLIKGEAMALPEAQACALADIVEGRLSPNKDAATKLRRWLTDKAGLPRDVDAIDVDLGPLARSKHVKGADAPGRR